MWMPRIVLVKFRHGLRVPVLRARYLPGYRRLLPVRVPGTPRSTCLLLLFFLLNFHFIMSGHQQSSPPIYQDHVDALTKKPMVVSSLLGVSCSRPSRPRLMRQQLADPNPLFLWPLGGLRIESAQKDHATVVQNMIDNKALTC